MNKTIAQSHVIKIVEQMQRRLDASEAPLACHFAELFWSKTPSDDLAERHVEDDVAATIDNWRAYRHYQSGAVVASVSNPQYGRDGWQPTRTVVRIIAPNMPFVIDSILMVLSHDGLVTHFLRNVVFSAKRDKSHHLTAVDTDRYGDSREVFIYAEIDRLTDEALNSLHASIHTSMREVRACVEDFGAMKQKLVEWQDELQNKPANEEIIESLAFLSWLGDNHFTFLGYREFRYADDTIEQVPGSSLGILRERPEASSRKLSEQSAVVRDFLLQPVCLAFSKSGTLSRVHRHAYPDYIGFRQTDDAGNVVGEFGFLGLYTSRVYLEHPSTIPVVRLKVGHVIATSDLDPSGFDGKVLAQVLATYPRDELFQIDEGELFKNAMAITHIHERRRTKIFTRFGRYGLFVVCLVYVPRDLFNTFVRLQIQNLLIDAFDAIHADFEPYFSESILVRLHFTLRINPGLHTEVDIPRLEANIVGIMRDWVAELTTLAETNLGSTLGRKLAHKYAHSFPVGYQSRYSTQAALDDITQMERLGCERALVTSFYRVPQDPEESLHLKIYHRDAPLPLSDVIPALENIGLRVIGEASYEFVPAETSPIHFHDFNLLYHESINLVEVTDLFEQAFVGIWARHTEDDRFNKLIFAAKLGWRMIALLRGYARYNKQLRFGFSLDFIADTLANHPKAARLLADYFEERFHPERNGEQLEILSNQYFLYLDTVVLLNEDRILRRFIELINATVRTNFYMPNRPVIALKISPREISNVPPPVPYFEIFISSPHVEGVHLRGGPIARGGLRWSDRLEDYRTEVLGLVKAQAVKNAVIVPTGAKGGFVIKRSPTGDRARDGVFCYSDFIRGLLDVTDNIVDGHVLHPTYVRIYDGEDPYLVVAADKGTAAYSDIANTIAEETGFWLGDAFASGGSNGYDHKAIGITARGAWISVQRHFSEQGIDVQRDTVTVIGIGDMAGDVFGNGMLLSQSIQLVAAFNHLHIFIDPNPDQSSSYAERLRLFGLKQSSWSDYDKDLISSGGGVFSRAVKSITISEQMRERFDITVEACAPDELIREILKAPVGLIWNGGIGTYVKDAGESDDDVGDRGNDHLRVTADQLRCKVFGEGGNLGVTQLGRVSYSLTDGRMNTDFIDNSAGVDCSDHEVNIKVLLNELVALGELSVKYRNQLLEEMTDDVTSLVLANSFHQAQAISIAERHSLTRHDEYRRLISRLESDQGLDRELEGLPSDDELNDRFLRGGQLTRPELAVLLAYSKSHIKQNYLGMRGDNDAHILRALSSAFPTVLSERYPDMMRQHRLREEIIATQLANDLVHHMGSSFVSHMMELVGASVTEICRAYLVAAASFRLREHQQEINDQQILALTKLDMVMEIVGLGRRVTRWLLRHRRSVDSINETVREFSTVVESLQSLRLEMMGKVAAERWQQRVGELVSLGVSKDIAERNVNAAVMAVALPIAAAAQRYGKDPQDIAHQYSILGDLLRLDWLTAQLLQLPTASHWQAMERDSLLDDVTTHQAMLAARSLDDQSPDGGRGVEQWLQRHEHFAASWRRLIEDAQQGNSQDFSMFSMTCRKLSDLCRALD
ncbi:MAG: NAD-glutamate dehydrogenase [Gammaproteobacteria bacterium]|nr:NAD-glutamate dehydrogenase [Gammaproteobacteria bacterium]